MLEERLNDLWNAQLSSTDEDATQSMAATLAKGVVSAARSLGQLNQLKPEAPAFQAFGNPVVGVFGKLESAGIDWGLEPEAKAALAKAQVRLARLATSAVVHGDVHLRNILVRADLDAHLIDYAGSGPGHPAVDLARLELALYLGVARQVDSEEHSIRLQTRLSLEGATAASLLAEFPEFHRCHVNRVCIEGCVAARNFALEAVETHGGDLGDYVAAKYLVAWQNLVMFGRQTGLCRAVIRALAPSINNW